MIFLVLSGKIMFLFPENMILHLSRKMKDDLSQKNTRKYDIFFKLSEKMVFSKRVAPGHDLSCIISKDGIFFPRKHNIFSLGRKWAMTFLKKYMDIWYFLCTRTGVTNVVSRPSARKKSKMVLSRKNTPKGDLERAPAILCAFMETFHVLVQALSCIAILRQKNRKLNI